MKNAHILFGWPSHGSKKTLRLMEVAAATPNARFLMAGGGDLLEWSKQHAPDNLTVLGWADASALWSVSDIGLTTSDNEGMPVVLLEAQFAGDPIVATDVGSVAEVVTSERMDLVTPPNSISLTTALQRILSGMNFRSELSTSAKIYTHEKFSIDANLSSHEKLYKSMNESG